MPGVGRVGSGTSLTRLSQHAGPVPTRPDPNDDADDSNDETETDANHLYNVSGSSFRRRQQQKVPSLQIGFQWRAISK